MNYLNVHTATLRSAEYVGAEPTVRATWWNLSAWCAEQENSGRIVGCRDWKDRRWQQTCAVTSDEVHAESDLWEWDGDDLIVWAYPAEKEAEVQAKRESGRSGGKARTQAKADSARENGGKGGRPKTQAQNPSTEPKLNPSSNPSETQAPNPTERKGKEGNGMEKLASLAIDDASESDGYAEILPTGAAADMLALERRVQSLRPGWNLGLTYEEQQALMRNARCLTSLDADGWQILAAYLAAKLPEGQPGWQPKSRIKFIETAPDVWSHASHWHQKRQPAPTVRAQIPTREASAEERAAALAEFRSLKAEAS